MAEDIGTELQTWLLGQETLVAMLDKDTNKVPRIHPAVLPQSAGKTPTAIVYHLISDTGEIAAGGSGGQTATRVSVCHAILQFDCYGPTPKLAARLRTKLKDVLDGKQRGIVGQVFATAIVWDGDRDETDQPMDGSEAYRFVRQCDYRISYQRPMP